MSSSSVLLLSSALGVLSHVAYFSRGEHHLLPIRYIVSVILASIGGTAVLFRIEDGGVLQAFLHSNLLLAAYFTGLYTSLITYRVFFHRLSRFPGPLKYAVSDLGFASGMKNLDSFQVLTRLHERYGPIVRTGPNTLSIIHADAPQLVYGGQSKCSKSHWYDITWPQTSMQLQRDRAIHDQQRRAWSPAFSDKAIRGYEQRIVRYQDALVEQLRAHGGQPLDITKWMTFYGWDAMGDLSFGEPFNMLTSSEEHWAVKLYGEGSRAFGWWLPVWAFRIITSIPGAMRDYNRFQQFTMSCLDKRMKNEPQIPNIMSVLLKPFEKKTPSPIDYERLHGDTVLIVVAGSDTSATTLTYACRCLALNPSIADQVRREIAAAGPDDGTPPQNAHLQHLPLLNAVINETLRLFPPVPSQMVRTTPAEGLALDGGRVHVPGGADVFCPQWPLARSEAVYAHAAEWIPERWTTRPELVRHAGAFIPFSLGPFGCIGKPLAMLSLRVTLARILLAFDLQLPSGGVPEVVGSPCEYFTLTPPTFNVVFKER